MRSATLIALLAAIALGLAGCGGAEVVGALPETVVGTVPQATTAGPSTTLNGDAAAGKDLYAAKGCGACHKLAAAGSSGAVGPNLDDTKPAFDLVVDRVTNGRGTMPPFKGQLSEQEIADVAAYVAESAGS